MATPAPDSSRTRQPIASTRHFLIMMLIQVVLVGLGFWLQSRPGSDSVLPQRRNAVPLYLSVIGLEWGLVATVRGAVNDRGIALGEIIGGRWSSWKDVVRDLALCILLFAAFQVVARGMHWLLGPDDAKSIGSLLPQSSVEVVLWIVVSISAGICEEIVFRGYFQQQFAAYTGSVVAGVLLQGLVFGFGHSYQGLKQVAVISALGVLYGGFAAWRRSLRPNMMSHASTDIWSGWLSRVLS